MSLKIDLKEIERKANHIAFQDGLIEIFMGIFLLFFGGAMGTKASLTPFVIFVIFFANPILKRVKVRYIYPRIGYVKLPQEDKTEAKGILVAAILFVIFLVASLLITRRIMGAYSGGGFWMTYILPPTTGFMMAIGPFWLGQTYGLLRGYIFAALFLIMGFVIPLFGVASGYEAVGLICSVLGLITLTVGIVYFTRFLRKFPTAVGELRFDEGENNHA